MDFTAQLAQYKLDPALENWIKSQREEAQKSAEKIAALNAQNAALNSTNTALNAELHNKECKIQALSFELAYLKRIKFSAKTEAFTIEQRDLFI